MIGNGNGNGYLTRDDLLATAARKYEDVTLPGLGKVKIRSSTSREYTDIEVGNRHDQSLSEEEKSSRFKARLIAHHLTDADGNRLFTDQPDDLDLIEGMGNAVVQKVGNAILQMNGLSDDTIDDAKKN